MNLFYPKIINGITYLLPVAPGWKLAQTAIRSTDFTTASGVNIDVPECTVEVEANTVYSFSLTILLSGGATDVSNISFSFPTGLTIRAVGIQSDVAVYATAGTLIQTASLIGATGNTNFYFYQGKCTTTNAGTLKLQMITAASENATLYAGSGFQLIK